VRAPDPATARPAGSVDDRPGTLSRVSLRVAVTTIDQGVASVSNFAVGVAVARVAGVAGLGAYSLAYTAWLVLAAVHRSLITDPMAIENDLSKPNAHTHVRSGLAAEFTLGLACMLAFLTMGGVLLSLGQHAYGLGFIAIAPWLPFLLAQDYWRWIGFMQATPTKSLANDLVFLIVQMAMFGFLVIFGIRSTVLAIGAWGIGALVSTIYGLRQFHSRPSLYEGTTRLRMRWRMSKWLLGTSTSSWGASQAAVILTGVILGPVGLGGLKAATSLVSGPALVLVQAGGSVGLPEASRSLSRRGWPGLRRVERFVTLAGFLSVSLVALVILLFGHQLLTGLYGSQFGKYSNIANILSVSFLVMALGLGAILSLKATRQTRKLFTMGLVSLVGSIVAVGVLAPIYGLNGAAWALVVSSSLTTISVVSIHLRHSRRAAEMIALPEPSESAGEDPVLVGQSTFEERSTGLTITLLKRTGQARAAILGSRRDRRPTLLPAEQKTTQP
jgi:O-antigen/teichoic acid export membrane protein